MGMAGVVLDELVGSNVPNFDARVGAASGDESSHRMKGDAVYVARVLVKCLNALFRVAVPQLDRLVVRSAHNEPRVFRELGTSYPVRVLVQ